MAKRSLRVLASADHHMSNNLPYALPSQNGRTDRLDQQLAAWDQMRDYAIDVEADMFLLLGDLFDKARLDPVTLVETAQMLVALSLVAPIYVLPGNHDAHTIKGERFNVELFKSLDANSRITYLHHDDPLDFGHVMLWPVEYMPVEQMREVLKWAREQRVAYDWTMRAGQKHILLFHASVVGCEHLAWLCDDGMTPEEMLDGFDWAIGGHFHTHQKFGPDDRGMYCGSWMQHDFGDVGETRGFWDIKIKGGKRTDKLVPTSTPRFWRPDLAQVPDEARKGDYIRWEAECTHADYQHARVELEKSKRAMEQAGYRVDYKHKPIYHHAERIIKTDEMASVSMRKMVDRYVDSDEVNRGDLKAKRLKKLGADIMAEARLRDDQAR